MSIEMKTERNIEGPFAYGVYPEMRCDVCQRKINTMNPGAVMGVVKKATPAYHVHKGKCMNEFLDASTEDGWVTDEVHNHFFRLLFNLGFFVENDQIILERPI